MKAIFGEYDCKLDAKGRFKLPAALLKQLPEAVRDSFVINRGLDNCLVMYPLAVWEAELQKIYQKNQYIAKNRAFARKFINGAIQVELDGNSRALIPKRLAEYVGLEKNIVLVAAFDRIEIWSQARYEAWLSDEQLDMEKLSEEVMGQQDESQ